MLDLSLYGAVNPPPSYSGTVAKSPQLTEQCTHSSSNRLNRGNSYRSRAGWQMGALAMRVTLCGFLSDPAQAGSIVTFDAPGAGTSAGQGTYA